MRDLEWSAADAAGVRTRQLDVGAQVTLRGRRLRQREAIDQHAQRLWPQDWQQLIRDWLEGSATPKWATLLKKAGPQRSVLAPNVLEALLQAGWIELEETREHGRWVPLRLTFRDFETLRGNLGLPNRTLLAQQHAELLARPFADAALVAAAQHLAEMPPQLAIRRHRWLRALETWCADQRNGTRRDFALFAAGDTKGLPDADWNWLLDVLDLSAFSIEAHTPLLLIRAPLHLQPSGLNLAAAVDFLGLTPNIVAAGSSADGKMGCWRLIENRTSFERAARQFGANDGVVWLPGYPPTWWRDTLRHLIRLHPVPLLIACDPDPAGIEIATLAAQLWSDANLRWQPWHMGADTLDRLPTRKPLTEDDYTRLARLLSNPLHPMLRELAEAMQQHGYKGEQEGLRLD